MIKTDKKTKDKQLRTLLKSIFRHHRRRFPLPNSNNKVVFISVDQTNMSIQFITVLI